jgi:hypothetical protein
VKLRRRPDDLNIFHIPYSIFHMSLKKIDSTNDIWNLEFGIWNMEYGIWNMEYGIWNMEYGFFSARRV